MKKNEIFIVNKWVRTHPKWRLFLMGLLWWKYKRVKFFDIWGLIKK